MGLLEVKLKAVQINSVGTRRYWDGSGWNVADQLFNLPTTPGGGAQTIQSFTSQVAAISDGSFTDGYRYEVIARAGDLLGFQDPVYSTTSFIVDRSTPSAALLAPLAGTYLSTTTLTLSSGTFNEPVINGLVPSGLTLVRVQIEDVSDLAAPAHVIPGGLRFWTGSGWQGTQASTTAVLYTSSWAVSNLPTDWVRGDASPNGRQYAVRALSVDLAGNTGVFPNYVTARATITFDGTPPTSSIVTPPDGLDTTSLATITGQAVDPIVNASSADVRAVYVSVLSDPGNTAPNSFPGWYWNAQSNSWVPSVVWNATTFAPVGGEWTFNSATITANLTVGSFYIINSSAADRAGNASPLPAPGAPAYSRVRFLPPPSVTAISAPSSLQFYNYLPSFAGTANGVTSSVEVQLSA